MCCCDDNAPEVYHETRPKARKPHRCCECGRTIEAGETYRRAEGIWDGDFGTFKACAHCVASAAILESFETKDFCICVYHGGLWENFRDYARDVGRMALFRLIVARDRKWRFGRGPRKGQLMPVPTKHAAAAARVETVGV